jgi:hypothetical protein
VTPSARTRAATTVRPRWTSRQEIRFAPAPPEAALTLTLRIEAFLDPFPGRAVEQRLALGVPSRALTPVRVDGHRVQMMVIRMARGELVMFPGCQPPNPRPASRPILDQ